MLVKISVSMLNAKQEMLMSSLMLLKATIIAMTRVKRRQYGWDLTVTAKMVLPMI